MDADDESVEETTDEEVVEENAQAAEQEVVEKASENSDDESVEETTGEETVEEEVVEDASEDAKDESVEEDSANETQETEKPSVEETSDAVDKDEKASEPARPVYSFGGFSYSLASAAEETTAKVDEPESDAGVIVESSSPRPDDNPEEEVVKTVEAPEPEADAETHTVEASESTEMSANSDADALESARNDGIETDGAQSVSASLEVGEALATKAADLAEQTPSSEPEEEPEEPIVIMPSYNAYSITPSKLTVPSTRTREEPPKEVAVKGDATNPDAAKICPTLDRTEKESRPTFSFGAPSYEFSPIARPKPQPRAPQAPPRPAERPATSASQAQLRQNPPTTSTPPASPAPQARPRLSTPSARRQESPGASERPSSQTRPESALNRGDAKSSAPVRNNGTVDSKSARGSRLDAPDAKPEEAPYNAPDLVVPPNLADEPSASLAPSPEPANFERVAGKTDDFSLSAVAPDAKAKSVRKTLLPMPDESVPPKPSAPEIKPKQEPKSKVVDEIEDYIPDEPNDAELGFFGRFSKALKSLFKNVNK